jgi:hypothetical protein
MKPQVVMRLLAASAAKRYTSRVVGCLAVVDFFKTVCLWRILKMMKTETEKQVKRYEKKMMYGRVFVSAPSGGGVRFM